MPVVRGDCIVPGMASRTFYDPETEVPVLVTECPVEKAGGGVSPRLKCWAFTNADNGLPICSLRIHQSTRLHAIPECDLEALYLLAMEED